MITYPYEYLFKQDSVDKQLIITDGEITLTNVDIYQESFELTEVLSATRDLTYGSCKSATLRFTTSKLERFKGRTLTVSVVLDGHTESPFTFGTYKVYEDKYTADRTKKDLVCYDALYEVINANVIDWYNTILPDMNTTVTVKQFRDSFFNHFGITQETITLDNDTETISKTVEGEVLSGADVLRRICEINGCFGRINRQGNFEYFYVHTISSPVYPSLTLYPDTDLYPQFDGQYDATEIGENGTYISAQYEDYDCMPVDKLIVRQEDGDVGVEVGTGTNKYIIQGNFLLFGKSTTDLTRIANNIYSHIEGAYYRPCEIELKGNPCLEIGDGVVLITRQGDKIVTFVTHRVYSGIQAQRDVYTSEGSQYRDEEVNTIDTRLYQLRNKSNILTRDLEHTESIITDEILDPDNPDSLQSQITQTAGEISAKVDQINGESTDSFSWEMIPTKFDIKNNGNSVLKVTSSGAEINGKVTAKSGYIGNGSNGFEIGNTSIQNGMTSLSDTTHDGIYLGTDGIALGKGVFKIESDGDFYIKGDYLEMTPSSLVFKDSNENILSYFEVLQQMSNKWLLFDNINLEIRASNSLFLSNDATNGSVTMGSNLDLNDHNILDVNQLNGLPPNTYMGDIGTGEYIIDVLKNDAPLGISLWRTQQADDSPTKGSVSCVLMAKHTSTGAYSYVYHFAHNGTVRCASTGNPAPTSLSWSLATAQDTTKEPKVSWSYKNNWNYYKDSGNRYHLHYLSGNQSINFNGSIGNLKYRTTTFDINFPVTLTSVHSIQATAVCGNDIVGVTVQSYTTSAVKLWLWASTSGTKTVQIFLDVTST